MDFNHQKDSYRQTVEASVAFAGQGLDFYTRVKADAVGRILKQAGTAPRQRLLDLGCGHGYIHPLLSKLGCDVVGVETATEVLPLAREANPDAEYVGYDGSTLPFQDGTFDVVLAVCVLHHVLPSQWPSLLTEAKRTLRRGGRIIIFEHNPLNPLTRYVVSRNEIDADAVLLTHRRLNGLLSGAGFTHVQARFILFTPFANSLARNAEIFLDRVPLGAQYYSTAIVPSIQETEIRE